MSCDEFPTTFIRSFVNSLSSTYRTCTTLVQPGTTLVYKKVKDGKGTSWICIAPIVRSSPLKRSGTDHTTFTLQTHHTCLHLVSVHQMAPPLTIVIAAIWLQLTTHLSTPRKWKAGLAQLADLQRTVFPYKWLYPSATGQMQARESSPLTFYH